MKIETEIKRWGNSNAIRLSGVMSEIPHFSVGTKVLVKVTEKGLYIEKIKKPQKRLPFSEKQLLAGMTHHTAHHDELPEILSDEWE